MAHSAYKIMLYLRSLSAVVFQARIDEKCVRTSQTLPVRLMQY
jgi:hypothetical protein